MENTHPSGDSYCSSYICASSEKTMASDQVSPVKRLITNKMNLAKWLSSDHIYILNHAQAALVIDDRVYNHLKYMPQPEAACYELIDKITNKGEGISSQFLKLLELPEILETYPQLKEWNSSFAPPAESRSLETEPVERSDDKAPPESSQSVNDVQELSADSSPKLSNDIPAQGQTVRVSRLSSALSLLSSCFAEVRGYCKKHSDVKKTDSDSSDLITDDEEIRIVLVGKTGAGKSASGNTILGREAFTFEFSPNSVTKTCNKESGEVAGLKVSVIDTPGLFDTGFDNTETIKEVSNCITFAAPGPHVFLAVIQKGRYTEEERNVVAKIQEEFGESSDKYTMILFTHGDKLKGQTIEEFVKGSPELLELISKYGGVYHVFNNESKDPSSQVTELLVKINQMVKKNGGSHYTNQMFQEAARKQVIKNDEEIRIVMVGKTGAGKSASGNTILRYEAFKAVDSPASGTKTCNKKIGKVDGIKVSVIDTPGLFDTEFSNTETIKEVSKCITCAAPGPQVFLAVIKLGRFTEEERKVVAKIQKEFGQSSDKYTMILFTHGDNLKGSIEEFVKVSPELQELISKYSGFYHVFNNESQDPSQVTELLEKIHKMVKKNGGSHYTNQMFQEAARKQRKRRGGHLSVGGGAGRILDALQDLSEDQFKMFRFQLQQSSNLEGQKPLKTVHLEKKDLEETATLIWQTYPKHYNKIMVNILTKIPRSDLREPFEGGHLSADRILDTLEDLGDDEFEKFRWQLRQATNYPEGLEPLQKAHLGPNKSRNDVTDMMVQTYPDHYKEIMVNVLTKIDRKDLAKLFEDRRW